MFTPITLKNYNDGRCGYSTPKWAKDALLAGVETNPSVYAAATDVVSYENIEKRPYIHLLDSGISDNIGIRSPALMFSVREVPASQVDRIEDGTIKKLAVILVNAKPKTFFKGDLKATPPGVITSVNMAAGSPLVNYSYETVNLLKRSVRQGRDEVARYNTHRRACNIHARAVCKELGQEADCYDKVLDSCYEKFQVSDDASPSTLEIYVIHISFELIDDSQRRQRFQSIPTKLQLPREDIEDLIGVAPELMNEVPEFHHLVRDLDAYIADKPEM